MHRRAFLALAGSFAVTAACGGGKARESQDSAGDFYQRRDYESHNYRTYLRDGLRLRGPDPGPLIDRHYIACAGGAQTFGTCATLPFPQIVTSRTGYPHLNMGRGAAGPRTFARSPVFIDWINRSRFCVLQVLSGRSAGNSLMEHVRGRRVIYMGEEMTADEAWALAVEDLSIADLWRIVDETRADWLASYKELLHQLTVPVVLFYFSQRPPITREDRAKRSSRRALWQGYPQMVTRAMVDEVKGLTDRYVECITSLGMPQKIVSRFTGEFIRWNGYYPSPEMHEAAADALIPVCREMWVRADSGRGNIRGVRRSGRPSPGDERVVLLR